MIRIAVVDDEERIRHGLVKLIGQYGELFQVVAACASGQELLDRMGGLRLDLIITDIKMPQMTGLQMIERVRRRDTKVKFAVLSGFNDFAFARQAIRFGVEDYLLKPVDEEELAELLHRVHGQAEQERYRKSVAVDEHLRLLLRSEIKHLPEHMAQGAVRELGRTSLLRDHFAVFVLRCEPDAAAEAIERSTDVWSRERKVIAWEPRLLVIAAAIGKGDHADTIRELGHTLLQRLPQSTQARVGASGIHQGPAKLREAYLEAENCLQTCWYEPGAKAMLDAFHAPKPAETDPNPALMLDREFRPALQLLDLDRAGQALRGWLDDLIGRRASWRTLREGSEAVFDLIRCEKRERRLPVGEETEDAAALVPVLFPNGAAFSAAFLAAAEKQLGALGSAKQENRVVETVKAFVQTHYTEELELQRLADTVFLTPSYLSKLFKTETGETITDYIISVRIERAKERLIKEPALKTYEIGERVGYPDPTYFNKVFKKVVGLTPKEYRERVRL
ncbi:response regulator [Cohnella zeiphila]|uniref:Response regulator n=1 Tax=Cohnella zeiphila TaxID=2761120 RepID=A0A7X0SGW2_9BACL|nr:response regulator [Cohnella zeiphila]MBB6729754.1 response regulator [Cohnella zeiphila]